jgi:hypothetical protein
MFFDHACEVNLKPSALTRIASEIGFGLIEIAATMSRIR